MGKEKDYDGFDDELKFSSFKKVEKEGFFSRLFARIKSLFSPYRIDEKNVNQPAGYYNDLSRDDLSRSYDDVRRASLLCERALKIAGVRADLAAKQQTVREKLNELEKFEKMPAEEKHYITNLLQKYKDVTREKQRVRGQMSEFTKMLDYLEPYEKTMDETIQQIDDAEDKQRRVKMDIGFIDGERSDLEFQKEDLEHSLETLHRVTVGMVIFFAAAAIFLLYLYLGQGIEIFAYALYASIAFIIMATVLYIVKRRLVFEDKLNVMLQIRAVELLNKKRLLYVHYTSFLNYEYKKYRVNSAWELRSLWSEYGYYKQVNQRFTNIRNLGYAIEDELHTFLKKYGLQNSKTSVESFSKILDFENNKKQYKRFSDQQVLTDAKLADLEKDQNEVWQELLALKDRDTTKEKVIERMMQEYFEDVSKVMPIEDEVDTFNYGYGKDEEE